MPNHTLTATRCDFSGNVQVLVDVAVAGGDAPVGAVPLRVLLGHPDVPGVLRKFRAYVVVLKQMQDLFLELA